MLEGCGERGGGGHSQSQRGLVPGIDKLAYELIVSWIVRVHSPKRLCQG
jgi:hypothetical protein